MLALLLNIADYGRPGQIPHASITCRIPFCLTAHTACPAYGHFVFLLHTSSTLSARPECLLALLHTSRVLVCRGMPLNFILSYSSIALQV